jgi:hypothetical protein
MTGILEGDGDEQVRIPSTIVTREVAEDAKTFLREHSGIDFDAFHAGATVESLLGEAQESTSQIGDIEPEVPHKGEVYGGIFPGDNKPIWFSAAHKLMNHYNAAAWATEQGGALPTREQGDYLMTLKGKGGAFTELFNRRNSSPGGFDGFIWLAESCISRGSGFGKMTIAMCQEISDGGQGYIGEGHELPVLSIFR